MDSSAELAAIRVLIDLMRGLSIRAGRRQKSRWSTRWLICFFSCAKHADVVAPSNEILGDDLLFGSVQKNSGTGGAAAAETVANTRSTTTYSPVATRAELFSCTNKTRPRGTFMRQCPSDSADSSFLIQLSGSIWPRGALTVGIYWARRRTSKSSSIRSVWS